MSDIPGPKTRALIPPLLAHESRNVTYVAEDFPVFWQSASGARVTDVDGNDYIDLTAAFGVANVGHANAAVVDAIATQAALLPHGMGDVHPTSVRTRLLERLPSILPQGLTKTFLASTGAEAVEAAMKTAVLATGRHRFVTYDGAYHGLTLGALALAGIDKFVTPFAPLVANAAVRLPYPDAQRTNAADALAHLRATLEASDDIAAIVIEPIQGRGGGIVPPRGYLPSLRAYCDARGVLLIFDEIYTGYGRTGDWFACDDEDVTPDVICIGKAMGGGFPISAAVARAAVMDAWPRSSGEALHTSTYLGNPMGCAAALAVIDEVERLDLVPRAREIGRILDAALHAFVTDGGARAARGRGAMWALQLRSANEAERIVKAALARGLILLQAGPNGDALSITPPLVITSGDLHRALDIIREVL
jgi:4-aminobutyrate aminotransferase-like enzyme